MAYDEDLANRIRELLADEEGVTEMSMFGGLAFLLGGNMAVAASGQGGLLVRVDPAERRAAAVQPSRKRDGDARARDERVDPRRRRGRSEQAPAGPLGAAGRAVRARPAGQGLSAFRPAPRPPLPAVHRVASVRQLSAYVPGSICAVRRRYVLHSHGHWLGSLPFSSTYQLVQPVCQTVSASVARSSPVERLGRLASHLDRVARRRARARRAPRSRGRRPPRSCR